MFSKTYKPLSLLALTVVLSSSILAGCSTESSTTEQATSKKDLNFAWNKDIGDLNPHLYAPSQWFAQAMVYEGLVNYGDGGKIEPSLAETWDVAPDGKSYTFHLRKGVKFSDGTDFNAGIVKKNFDAVLKNAAKHDWLALINEIDKTEAVDDSTFKLTLKHPYYPVLQELAMVRPLRMLGDAGFLDDGTTATGIKKPIGTGPWVLSEYKKDDYAVFTRNEHYWGTKPKLDSVKVKVIPDSQSRVLAFENKEIDLLFGNGQITLDSYKQLKEAGIYNASSSEALATRVLAIHSNKGATKELKVRQALEHALDKQALIDNVFYGTEQKADTLFSPNFPYSNLSLKPYEFDLEQAKKLLEEAGWKLESGKEFRTKGGQELTLELGFDSGEVVQKTIAEYVQGQLGKIGVKLNLIGEEYQTHVKRQKDGNFNMIFSETWGAPYDPHTVVGSMREPSHADFQAQSGLSMKKELDGKISQVLVSTDEKARQDLYRDVLTTLHEQAVYLPISYITNLSVSQQNLTGVSFLPTQYEIPFANMEFK